MKRLIRNKSTQTFLTSDGKWTSDYHNAWDIPEYRQALATVERLELHNVEVYYCYDDEKTSQVNFAVPLE